MGAHPDVFERLTQRLIAARDPLVIDALLDQWIDARFRASDWDAAQWGFAVAGRMHKERLEMGKRDLSSKTPKVKKT